MTIVKLLLMGFLSFCVMAEESNSIFESRLHSLVENLRCPVCQNESLASSHAPLAQDLRKTVQAQMEQGKSDHEILNFLKERYGDFIYYQPPLKSTTLVLWFGPFILLIAGVLGLLLFIKRRVKLGKKQ